MPPYLGLPSIPPDLKAIAPYLQRADETKSQDPIISYWCTSWAILLTVVVLLIYSIRFFCRCLLRCPDRHLPQGCERTEPRLPLSSPYRARKPPFCGWPIRCRHRRQRVFRVRGELCLARFRVRGRRGQTRYRDGQDGQEVRCRRHVF